MRWTGCTRRRPGLRLAGLRCGGRGGAAGLASLLGLAVCVATFPGAAGAELLEGELPAWIPSVGFGIGIQARPIDGRVGTGEQDLVLGNGDTISIPGSWDEFADFFRWNEESGAWIKTDVPTTSPNITVDRLDFQRCFIPRTPAAPNGTPNLSFNGFCAFDTDDSRTLDGTSLPLSVQLMGPAAESLPGRPRLFGHGTFGFNFDRRPIVGFGLKPGDFSQTTIGGTPLVRLELEGESKYTWFVGGGLALQLPFDRPSFLKLSAHYSEDTSDVLATIDRGFSQGVDNDGDGNIDVLVRRAEDEEELTIRGVGGAIGLETEVVRRGPIAVNLSLDFFVTRALGSNDVDLSADQGVLAAAGETPCPPGTENSLLPNNNACLGPVSFDYEPEDLHYYGGAMIRFVWLGF